MQTLGPSRQLLIWTGHPVLPDDLQAASNSNLARIGHVAEDGHSLYLYRMTFSGRLPLALETRLDLYYAAETDFTWVIFPTWSTSKLSSQEVREVNTDRYRIVHKEMLLR